MARVIILEDDEDLGPLLMASLRDAGHVVQLFTSANDAVQSYKQESADVFVADIIIRQDNRALPDGGLTAIFNIKAHAKRTDQKVAAIAISGVMNFAGMQDTLKTAQQIGADLALAKPFSPDELISTIETVLPAA